MKRNKVSRHRYQIQAEHIKIFIAVWDNHMSIFLLNRRASTTSEEKSRSQLNLVSSYNT